MRKGVTPWIAAGFLAIAGCGAAVDSADTVAEWAVADAVWIGAVEGDGPDVFGSISALAVDADGRILVFDDQAHELTTFAPDGSFLSRFGRRGGGPGEFKHVIGLSPAPDGSLWIVDGQNARYTVLRDGAVVATYRRGAGVYTVPWVGGHGGEYLYDVVLVPGGDPGEVLVRVNADGVATGTSPVPVESIEMPRIGSIELPLPFAPRQLRAFDPAGFVWTANSHVYALYRIGPGGDTVQVITQPIEPRPLTAAESDSVARYIRTMRSEFGVDVRDALVPRTAPLLRRITIANDGSIWVTLADPPAGSPRGTRFDIFEPGGRRVAELTLDFPFTLQQVRNGRIYGVARDELGVERVFTARVP